MSVYLKMVERWDVSRIAFESIDRDQQSYAELHQQVLNAVAWLRSQGPTEGDVFRVYNYQNHLDCCSCCWQVWYGVVILPLNDRYTASEVSYYIHDVRATLSIVMLDPEEWDGEFLLTDDLPNEFPFAGAVELSAIPEDALALLLYTSGTTDGPKGAMISHGNVMASVQALHEAWQWTSDDRLLHLLPLFHVHGLVVAQFGALC